MNTGLDVKNLSEGLPLLAGEKVAITPHHILRLVAHPFIDDALVHPLGRTVGGKGMPQHVPTPNRRPFAREHALQVVVGLIDGEGRMPSCPFRPRKVDPTNRRSGCPRGVRSPGIGSSWCAAFAKLHPARVRTVVIAFFLP